MTLGDEPIQRLPNQSVRKAGKRERNLASANNPGYVFGSDDFSAGSEGLGDEPLRVVFRRCANEVTALRVDRQKPGSCD
jgi:hypothetical protein